MRKYLLSGAVIVLLSAVSPFFVNAQTPTPTPSPTSSPTPTPIAVPNGLIGYWSFDSSTISSGGWVSDLSSSGSNAQLQNFSALTQIVTGAIGQAINLDGTSQYATLRNLGSGVTTSFTVTMWVKRGRTTFPGNADRLFGGGCGDWGIYLNPNSTFGLTNVCVNGQNSNLQIADTSWHFLSVRYTPTGGTATFNVDGSANEVHSGYYFTNYTNSGLPYAIGDLTNDTSAYFRGSMDDVRVYNRVLADSEVATLYGLGPATSPTPSPSPTTSPSPSPSGSPSPSPSGSPSPSPSPGQATLVSIAVTRQPNKTVYAVGDPLDLTGLGVTGTYSDSSTAPIAVTTAQVTGFNTNAPGSQTLTITAGGLTTTFTVTVNATPPPVSQTPSAPVPLMGWGWSSNVGWISFNSANTEIAGLDGSPYAVKISTTTTEGMSTGSGADAGLLGLWTFDSPTVSNGSVSDMSGNSNTAQLNGSPSIVAGQISQAVYLNGTNQYVSTAQPFNANLSTNFTLSAWVNMTSMSPTGVTPIVQVGQCASGGMGTAGETAVGLNLRSGVAELYRYDGALETKLDFPWTPSMGTWTHILIVDNAGTVSLYANGAQVGSSQSTATSFGAISLPLQIGKWQFSGSCGTTAFFSGSIDDVRVYSRALSSSDVSALYTAGVAHTSEISQSVPGNFTGYAWSPNVGWISFNASDLDQAPACPGGSGAAANANLTTGSVTGYVRVVSGIGSWGGCIELSGTNHSSPDLGTISLGGNTYLKGGVTYQVQTISTSPTVTKGIFDGFGWESGVLGWLSFRPFGLGDLYGVNIPVSCSGAGCNRVGMISGTCTASSPAAVGTNPVSGPNASLNLAINGGTVTFSVTGIVNTSGDGNSTYSEYWNGSASPASAQAVAYSVSPSSTPTVVVKDALGATSQQLQCPAVSVATNSATNSDISLLAYKNNTTDPGATTIKIRAGQPAYLGWTTTESVAGYTCAGNIPVKPSTSQFGNSVWQSYLMSGITQNAAATPRQITSSSNALTAGTYVFQIVCNPPLTQSFDFNHIFSWLFNNAYAQGALVMSNQATIIVTNSNEGEI